MIDNIEQGRTINVPIVQGSLGGYARKRQGKLTCGVLLLQGNAPTHTSQVAMTAVSECGFEILFHPPYSPDMASPDFYLL